jgi:hypothetical protein
VTKPQSVRDRVKRAVPQPVTGLTRRSLVRYGVSTSHRRPLPDFLIIGTKRGGTTSLWNYLIEHPLVPRLFPAWNTKASHYFEENWNHDLAWYRSHFPTSRQRQRLERHHGGPSRVGEAAPLYMFHPLAAQRVHKVIPGVRIIVLLRDPVERAYSHWKERRTNNVEPLSFSEALVAEPERTAGERARLIEDPSYFSEAFDWYSYRARGRYLEHLEPWLELFDRSQFLFIASEDLYRSPSDVYATTLSFLGLPPRQLANFEVYNDRPSDPMDAETRRELVEYYHPHNLSLSSRLGIDFDWANPNS